MQAAAVVSGVCAYATHSHVYAYANRRELVVLHLVFICQCAAHLPVNLPQLFQIDFVCNQDGCKVYQRGPRADSTAQHTKRDRNKGAQAVPGKIATGQIKPSPARPARGSSDVSGPGSSDAL